MRTLLYVSTALAFLRAPTQEPNDFNLDVDTWLGAEEIEGEIGNNASVLSSLNQSADVAKGRPYIVLGQHNTGTNLLSQLVQINFPARGHQIPSTVVAGIPPSDVWWKHAKPAGVKMSLQSQMRSSNAVALVMLRDPMSWLQSMKKAPYDLKMCTQRADWLTAPCSLPSSRPTPLGTAYMTPVSLANIESHWNEWTKDYGHLSSYGFNSAVLIRYEDIVMDTEGVLNRISAAIGVPRAEPTKHVHGSAKEHGSSNGRQAAILKLKTKSYLDNYNPKQKNDACARLDHNLLTKHQYTDCN
jgi:hypothetical protein